MRSRTQVELDAVTERWMSHAQGKPIGKRQAMTKSRFIDSPRREGLSNSVWNMVPLEHDPAEYVAPELCEADEATMRSAMLLLGVAACSCLMQGGSIRDAADEAGISHSDLYRRLVSLRG